ncbi:Lipopolysaccharide kinase (Kdo/WaaP) family protein [Malonomonas rubra DSM 5091]|uniref:Lipopolysaccharide kinase (Kdo/WaaP) family protein n=1 Tax=Malonomonas rubra DSM 5091 TaxID=1122189 RepID=A0A1M6C7Q5_MALRU|nr:lipopolysaccharide kinase InaA family protein [Malonomonas rubra]SHI56728.1 Lipopolysaccharide kinase (Kdo/WaaP) family protein [Malonomonas rubra DSM 5091]
MNEQTYYLNPDWQTLLGSNQLSSFEDFWALDIPTVDEGNYGRGQDGWSKVCIHNLDADNGQPHRIVIKRQSNYRSRTLRHPLRGIPTFVKEYDFIRKYEALQIPALKAVYFATRQQDGDLQAILVTEYLEGYRPLEDIIAEWTKGAALCQRKPVITCVAKLVAQLHLQGLEHRCLFPKHIFVPQNPETEPACLIDLEKTRSRPLSFGRHVRDLTALARRSKSVSRRDMLRFMHDYLGTNKLNADGKKLWRKISQRIDKKRR